MNKIYNNLSIENLIETTDWFNQFDKNQQEVIAVGLRKNVDVLIYAKKEFDWKQMREILWGLEANLDVSIYAVKEFDADQMQEIRLKLMEKSTL